MSLIVTKGFGKSGETRIRISDLDWSKTVIQKKFVLNQKQIMFRVNIENEFKFKIDTKAINFNILKTEKKFVQKTINYNFSASICT